ncbi:MAG: polysulfide reductase NrfD [Candidatus Marinimicrobia bacterium]|nr:polysulfide reductase NrfD [Candidatus Neomarinimicrobiota bacterium]MCF7829544.1 polysulfide reductase NrfD [Candidatus Neomarinimicrobiota bacterium]MCF7880058.1 polysulfide reductase NrfD [Candidatus Neomarinimicrobiota bacterium]
MTEFHWNWLIVNYLFLAGISAGAFATSGLANYLGGQKYGTVAKVGAYIAPFPVIIGTSLLLFDLGKPLRFWRLFAGIQWTSPMSIGSWLLSIFIVISLAYFLLWLPKPYSNFVRVPRSLKDIIRLKNWTKLTPGENCRWRLILGAVGLPLSVGVAMYTGVLLGAVPARPFWNTPMVAQLFLFSAMSTGVGAILVISAIMTRHSESYHEKVLLNSVDTVLIVFEIFMIIPFLLHQTLSTWSHKEAVGLIMGGEFTAQFWIGVILIGILIPLSIEIYELWHLVVKKHMPKMRINLGMISGGLVIIGGLMLRYVFVYAGQVSHFLPHY